MLRLTNVGLIFFRLLNGVVVMVVFPVYPMSNTLLEIKVIAAITMFQKQTHQTMKLMIHS